MKKSEKSAGMPALRAKEMPQLIHGRKHDASDSAFEALSAIYIAFAILKISIGIIFKSILRFLVKSGGAFFPAQFRKAGACLAALLFLAQPVFALDVEPVSSPLPVSRTEAPAGKNAADKADRKTITSLRKGFTQEDKEFIHDFVSIFLFMSGFYCGYKIISLYWIIKLWQDKKLRVK